MTELQSRVREILAVILGSSTEDIPEDAHADQLDLWDSLAHMNIILAVEEEFELRFQNEEIAKLTSIDAICASIKDKQNHRA